MKKFLLWFLCLSILNTHAIPVVIMENIPEKTKDLSVKFEAITNLQNIIKTISRARDLQSQLAALKDLNNFQQNPGDAVNQVNMVVKNLLKDFNQLNSSHLDNLSSLITGLSSSLTSEGMSLKLATASNMQLSAIEDALERLQAQQQMMIAYKQAEIEEKKHAQLVNEANRKATCEAMMKY